jgi:hypothetical protein
VLEVLLNVEVVLVVLLEPENGIDAFLHLVLYLVSVELDNRLGCVQESSVVLQFVDEQP